MAGFFRGIGFSVAFTFAFVADSSFVFAGLADPPPMAGVSFGFSPVAFNSFFVSSSSSPPVAGDVDGDEAEYE